MRKNDWHFEIQSKIIIILQWNAADTFMTEPTPLKSIEHIYNCITIFNVLLAVGN